MRPFEARTFRQGTSMLGANWHLSRQLTAYVAHSTSFQPSAGVTPANVPVPPGTGVGDEAGLKFGLFSDKLTGAVSFYSTKAKSNSANLPTDVWAIVDPFSNVNGKRNGSLLYSFDRETKGYEINVTAAPIRGLRVQAGLSHIMAKEGSDVKLPIYYNDQFYVNAAGQVTVGNSGAPLIVPVAPNTTNFSPLNPTPGVATQILTTSILRNGDASGNYKASLERSRRGQPAGCCSARERTRDPIEATSDQRVDPAQEPRRRRGGRCPAGRRPRAA